MNDQALDIIPQTEPHPQGLELNRRKLVERALANRMDVVRLELQLGMDQLGIETARNQTRPNLSLNGHYNLRSRSEQFSDSSEQLFQSPAEEAYIGLSYSMPIGNRAAESRLRRAELYKIVHALMFLEMHKHMYCITYFS